jgi:outer membrane protein assembly factor BamB
VQRFHSHFSFYRVISLALPIVIAPLVCGAVDWPQFRGPNGDGTTGVGDLPVTWSEQKNIRWKISLRGEGWSSPVIAARRIWMTSSLNDGRSLRALCVDAESGQLLQDIEVFRIKMPEPIENKANTHASPTPLLDRGRLFVSYGAQGNAALDANTGRILWRNQELRFSHDNNGPGSSPIVCSNLLIVACDGPHQPYIAALKADSGQTAWIAHRSKKAGKAFSTPIVLTVDGKTWLLSVASMRCSAYDPIDGREFWAIDLPGNTIVPSPVVRKDVAYLCTGFPKAEFWAVRLAGTGLVSEAEAVLWKYKKQVPQVSSPIIADDKVYFISDSGIVTCVNADTGQEIFSTRLGGTFYASPVAAAGKIYFPDIAGKTFVLATRSPAVILSTNVLAAGCYASPAVTGKALYLRTTSNLYRVE